MVLSNGARITLGSALGGGQTDDNGKTLKFKEDKDSGGQSFTAEGSDNQVYGFTMGDVTVTIVKNGKPDLVDQRKRGIPISKADAEKADEMIKQEKKAAKELRKKNRKKSIEAGTMTEEEAERQEKEEEEAEKEELKPVEVTTTTTGEKPKNTGFGGGRPKS